MGPTTAVYGGGQWGLSGVDDSGGLTTARWCAININYGMMVEERLSCGGVGATAVQSGHGGWEGDDRKVI